MNHQAHEEVDDHALLKGVVGLNKSETTGDDNHDHDQRWAEKLLNRCAAAITAGDFTRVQHLLYVLHELGSLTGDANQRLAAHGLRALTLHLCQVSSSATPSSISGASAGPVNFFQQSLRQFNEASPWFAFHNNLANSSILQILAHHIPTPTLHIVDFGVSHAMEWAPTLLERLNHRPCGPPPLVRISFISGTINESNHNSVTAVPFSVGPNGDGDFSTSLLAFAKSIHVNLQVNQLDNNHPLQKLNSSPDETLIVCTQFRLHQYLNHNTLMERNEFLKALRNMEPKGVILSENNAEYCSCNNCVDFATGFSRRVDYLWKFLDSTSSAFEDRALSNERMLMEEEAAKALTNQSDMNEGKEKWRQRMRGAGFVGGVFGEEAIDGAHQALLRKYHHNWEMRVEDKDGCVELLWKGQAVSFCSLWKLNVYVNNDG